MALRQPAGGAHRGMTNRLAIILFLCIIGFFVLDHYVLHWNAAVEVSRKGIELINVLAFWR